MYCCFPPARRTMYVARVGQCPFLNSCRKYHGFCLLIVTSSWKKGRNVCFCVGIFLICCYSCDTGATENKALIFEVLWALWWECWNKREVDGEKEPSSWGLCFLQSGALRTRIYGFDGKCPSALLSKWKQVAGDGHER